MAITVLEIQKLACLTKMNLIAGENGLNKEVQWIYIAECFEDPLEGTKWLQGGEIVFITGLAVKGRLNILEQLIQDIYDKKGVALIVNIGPYINKVPKNAIDIADKLNLPLFELPWEIKLTEVTKAVSESIIMSRIEENSLSNFLNNILFGKGEDGNLKDRVSYFGYNLKGKCNIILIRFNSFQIKPEYSISKIKFTLKKLINEILIKYSLKLLLTEKDDSIIIFAQNDDFINNRIERAIIDIQNEVKKQLQGITINIGIGNSYEDLNMMKKSLQEAEFAIDKAECFDCNNTITKYTDIGVFSLLFNIQNKETLKSYYNNILGSIENHTDYINILEVYLGEDCNLLSTAEKLFIHRNTLTYRINKIEKILNRNLHSFQDCVEIKLALYIRKILSKQ